MIKKEKTVKLINLILEFMSIESKKQVDENIKLEPDERINTIIESALHYWAELKILWRKHGIENDPLCCDETTHEIESLENKLLPNIIFLLNVSNAERKALHESAARIRDEQVGPKIDVRGVIELSNICRANCVYCPMRIENLKSTRRQRIDVQSIIRGAENAHKSGIKNLFLQSGEDPQVIPIVAAALRAIRAAPHLKDLEIVLNLGDHKNSDYIMLNKAGADGYLIKHETSDYDLHAKIRPHSTLEERVYFMLQARQAGMYIGTGAIVGLPGQTDESLARDIIFAGRIGSWEMVSCSPFTPSSDTPLAGKPAGDFYKTLNMIAIYRHLFPIARIPAVSNLDSPKLTSKPNDLPISGQAAAIKAGANGITVNLTPPDLLTSYKIYDSNNRHIVDFSKAQQVSRETGLPLDLNL